MPYKNFKRPRLGRQRKLQGKAKFGAKQWKFRGGFKGKIPGIGDGHLDFGNYKLNNRIKRVVSGMTETKVMPYIPAPLIDPLERTIYTMAPWYFVTNGTSGESRSGKEIFIRHFMMNMNIATIVPLKMRCLAVWLPNEKYQHPTPSSNTPYASGVKSNDLFVGGLNSSVDSLGLIKLLDNKIGSKVVYDKTYYVGVSDDASAKGSRKIKIDLPIMQKVKYEFEYSGGTPPAFVDSNLYFCFIFAKDQNLSTLTTTTLSGVRVDINGIMSFKDQD